MLRLKMLLFLRCLGRSAALMVAGRPCLCSVFLLLFLAVNVGLSVGMWLSIVTNVRILSLVYFVSPPCYYWVYYGLQLAPVSIPLRRHLGLLGQDFPNRIRGLHCHAIKK